jgi:hypothetical protein
MPSREIYMYQDFRELVLRVGTRHCRVPISICIYLWLINFSVPYPCRNRYKRGLTQMFLRRASHPPLSKA